MMIALTIAEPEGHSATRGNERLTVAPAHIAGLLAVFDIRGNWRGTAVLLAGGFRYDVAETQEEILALINPSQGDC